MNFFDPILEEKLEKEKQQIERELIRLREAKYNFEKCWGRQTYSVPLPFAEKNPSELCCLHDGEPFDPDKDPIKCPVKREYNGTILYCGYCCSLSCAAAFMEEHPRLFTPRSHELLVEMAKNIYNVRQPLVKARSIFSLIKYGGYLTIQQYRSYGPQHFSALQFPPFESQELRIEDTVPLGEIRTTKSREEFFAELEASSREMKAKKKRHSEKLYQNSLEFLITKRQKVPDSSSSSATLPIADSAQPKAGHTPLPPIQPFATTPEAVFQKPLLPKAPSPAAKPKASRKARGPEQPVSSIFAAFRSVK